VQRLAVDVEGGADGRHHLAGDGVAIRQHAHVGQQDHGPVDAQPRHTTTVAGMASVTRRRKSDCASASSVSARSACSAPARSVMSRPM